MSQFHFKIPGKTFMFGEYLALSGGPSLIVTTTPEFQASGSLTLERVSGQDSEPVPGPADGMACSSDHSISGRPLMAHEPRGARASCSSATSASGFFHALSPAGLFIRQKGIQLKNFHWTDPYNKKGGFGRSTAEFLSVYLAHHYALQGKAGSVLTDLTHEGLSFFRKLRKDYRDLHRNKHNNNLSNKLSNEGVGEQPSQCPSGADLVAQWMGGMSWVDPNRDDYQVLSWPWREYTFLIFHTGQKLATHDHLNSLEGGEWGPLEPTARSCFSDFLKKDFSSFAAGLNRYSDQLAAQQLAAPQVRQAVLQLRKDPRVRAAKGCGAMGVDTVLVLAKTVDQDAVRHLGRERGWEFIASAENISERSG